MRAQKNFGLLMFSHERRTIVSAFFRRQVDYNTKAKNRPEVGGGMVGLGAGGVGGGFVAVVPPLPVLRESPSPAQSSSLASTSAAGETSSHITFSL